MPRVSFLKWKGGHHARSRQEQSAFTPPASLPTAHLSANDKATRRPISWDVDAGSRNQQRARTQSPLSLHDLQIWVCTGYLPRSSRMGMFDPMSYVAGRRSVYSSSSRLIGGGRSRETNIRRLSVRLPLEAGPKSGQ